MLISKINNLKNEDLAVGLAFGLAGGLAGGLAVGLAVGLACGLAFGLACGLAFGLACGLAVILTNFQEALPFLYGLYPILILVFAIILVSEILFWLMPPEKIKKGKSIFWHTAKRKGENILEVLLFLSGIAQIYIFIREGSKYLTGEAINEILKWIGYIGLGIIIIFIVAGIFYICIKLNEVKYKT